MQCHSAFQKKCLPILPLSGAHKHTPEASTRKLQSLIISLFTLHLTRQSWRCKLIGICRDLNTLFLEWWRQGVFRPPAMVTLALSSVSPASLLSYSSEAVAPLALLSTILSHGSSHQEPTSLAPRPTNCPCLLSDPPSCFGTSLLCMHHPEHIFPSFAPAHLAQNCGPHAMPSDACVLPSDVISSRSTVSKIQLLKSYRSDSDQRVRQKLLGAQQCGRRIGRASLSLSIGSLAITVAIGFATIAVGFPGMFVQNGDGSFGGTFHLQSKLRLVTFFAVFTDSMVVDGLGN